MHCIKKNNGSSLKETRGRQARIHFYNLLIAKVLVHSCIFSMVSSLYLPFSFPSVRDLALRSRIFLRSLSSFSLVITTYINKKRAFNDQRHHFRDDMNKILNIYIHVIQCHKLT